MVAGARVVVVVAAEVVVVVAVGVAASVLAVGHHRLLLIRIRFLLGSCRLVELTLVRPGMSRRCLV